MVRLNGVARGGGGSQHPGPVCSHSKNVTWKTRDGLRDAAARLQGVQCKMSPSLDNVLC